jgi:hypothetical protein
MSPKGLRQSCGLMVNYLYDLDKPRSQPREVPAQAEVVPARAVAVL